MEKLAADDYSNPHQVTSIFKVSFERFSNTKSHSMHQSEACGLGWIFAAYTNRGLDGAAKDILLHFSPGAFNLKLGESSGASISVTTSPADTVKGPAKATLVKSGKKKLGASKARQLIGSYGVVNTAAKAVIFVITVILPEVLLPTVPIPSPLPSNTVVIPTPPSPITTPTVETTSINRSPSPEVEPNALNTDGLASYPKLLEVLEKSLQARISFESLRFVLMCKRVGSRELGLPQTLYANSELLVGRNAKLDALIKGEPTNVKISHSERTSVPATTYDYDSDSDLESEWNDDSKEVKSNGAFSVSDMDSLSLSSMTSTQTDGNGSSDQQGVGYNPNTEHTISPDSVPKQVIYIDDTAARTYKALLFYFYTGNIRFKPLSSDARVTPDGVSPDRACSPKAMYRLADKLDITELKALCKVKIRDGLYEDNIVTELSSIFTSRYPEIRKMQLNLLFESFIQSKKASSDLEVLMKAALRGKQAHSHEVLEGIFHRLLPKNY